MKSKVLLRRYTQGLINTIQSPEEFSSLKKDLDSFAAVLHSHASLNQMLESPFLPTSRKHGIAKEVLEKAGLEPKVERFILLLVNNERLGLLDEILAFLPLHWNEEQGITTFDVSSVVQLNDAQKKALAQKLNRLENRPVHLNFSIDPTLIGGLSIRKGNIVYDISLEGSLNRLKERICESE